MTTDTRFDSAGPFNIWGVAKGDRYAVASRDWKGRILLSRECVVTGRFEGEVEIPRAIDQARRVRAVRAGIMGAALAFA